MTDTVTLLEVGGVAYTDLHNFCVRWVAVPHAGPTPVLYRDGKRVTKPWRLVTNITEPADAHGGNANTQ